MEKSITYSCEYCKCSAEPKTITKEKVVRITKQEVEVIKITCRVCERYTTSEIETKPATLEYSTICNHGNYVDFCQRGNCWSELIGITNCNQK